MLSRIAVALGGLLFGVAIVAAAELVLTVLGVGDDTPLHDPFAGFSSAVPMFERVGAEGDEPIYRLSPARYRLLSVKAENSLGYEPQREFLVEKPDDEYRIFVIGGSSTQGVPYSTNYAFSTWLERRLDASLPEIDVKVVNAGMSSYASRRILPMVSELVHYEPDLLVVYMGHNEWAEKMYYEHLLNMDPRLFRVLEWVYRTRIYSLASNILNLQMFQTAPQLDLEFGKNTLQMWGVFRERAAGRGYPTPRELAFRDMLYEHNMRSIARTMKRAGVDVLLLTLSQNFSDWPPPASSHRAGFSADELQRWEGLVANGDQLAEEDCHAALGAYEEALAIDSEFADLHFRIADCYRALRQSAKALAHYRRASDLDRVPHGANTAFNEVIRRIADEEGAFLVDVDAVLIEESGDNLVGDDLFTDFAHPNIRAHQLIARAVGQAMREAGLPVEAEQWKDGYTDPAPADLYREEPRLAILELSSRVFVCALAPRDGCVEEATLLLDMDPNNLLAEKLLKGIAAAARH